MITRIEKLFDDSQAEGHDVVDAKGKLIQLHLLNHHIH